MPFYYGGCEGNGNNFDSLEDCQKSCPSQFLQMDVCEKPKDGGPCGDYEKTYVYTISIFSFSEISKIPNSQK